MPCELQHQVPGATESGQTERLSILQFGQPERPESYPAGAQQGCCLHIREHRWNRIGITLVHRHVFGVAAIDIAPGAEKFRTQVLISGAG